MIRYSSAEELIAATNRLEGQLTASLQLTEEDYPTAAPLLPALEQKVGRIIVNGWPTGVEVGHAMVHGGPFPATSDTRTTSVGTLAINRFLPPGRVPEPAAGTAARPPAGRQPVAPEPPHRRHR